MHIPFDVCLRCRKTRVVPSFCTTEVVPRCACNQDADSTQASLDFENAVASAYDAFVVECADEDLRQTLLRMQHFASSAGAALLEGNTKLFVSCLVSNAALSRLITKRALSSDENDEHSAGLDEPPSGDL